MQSCGMSWGLVAVCTFIKWCLHSGVKLGSKGLGKTMYKQSTGKLFWRDFWEDYRLEFNEALVLERDFLQLVTGSSHPWRAYDKVGSLKRERKQNA